MALEYMCRNSIAFGNFGVFIMDIEVKDKEIVVIMFAIAVNDVELHIY